MRNWFVRLFVPFVLIFILVGCSKKSENIEKVNVYKMVSFALTEKGSLITFSDSKVIEDFNNAVNTAKRVPGIADVAEPEYRVELGDKTYFLWISQESGSIMNQIDRNTLYTFSKSSVKKINELLK